MEKERCIDRMYDYKQEFSDNVDILGQSYRIEFLGWFLSWNSSQISMS